MARRTRKNLRDIETESFINAITAKLRKLFRGYKVYDESIPQNGEVNCFSVSLITAKQNRVVGKRYKRDFDFCISFFPAEGVKDEAAEVYKWEEKMLANFTALIVGGSEYHLKDTEISNSDGVWQFVFYVSFFVVEKEAPVTMRDLKQIRGVDSGGKKGS